MTKAIEVSDSRSNAEEQIEYAAKVIGRGEVRQSIFEAIYYHKMSVKTVSYVMERTGLTRAQVLQNGRPLVKSGIVGGAQKDGETAYEMLDFIHSNKRRILDYAARPSKLAKLPTKRKVSVSVSVTGQAPGVGPKAVALTVDDLDSFKAVRDVEPDGYISKEVSEEQFKQGIQAILGEPGVWKDWGGELADLATARMVYRRKRIGTVFAFKGPGQRGPLVPGKMGKNGDQLQRMYLLDGRLFVVQFVGKIEPSVNAQMRSLALAKSAVTGDTIYYLVIDGADSDRLYRAYPDEFKRS